MSELIQMNPELKRLLDEQRELLKWQWRGGLTMVDEKEVREDMLRKQREKECLECEEHGHCSRTTIYKFDGWCFKHPMKDKE